MVTQRVAPGSAFGVADGGPGVTSSGVARHGRREARVSIGLFGEMRDPAQL